MWSYRIGGLYPFMVWDKVFCAHIYSCTHNAGDQTGENLLVYHSFSLILAYILVLPTYTQIFGSKSCLWWRWWCDVGQVYERAWLAVFFMFSQCSWFSWEYCFYNIITCSQFVLCHCSLFPESRMVIP